MGGGAVSTEAILQGGDGTPLRCNRSENIFAADGMDVCAGGHGLGVMNGYLGEGEHRFRREAERHSGAKVNSSRSEATLAW